MRFESQTHPKDNHVDRITDCSTRYGQAPTVCTREDVFTNRTDIGKLFTVLNPLYSLLRVVAIFI